jgi:GTP pyrophosphokinase
MAKEEAYVIDEEAEKKEITRRYRNLLRSCKRITAAEKKRIRKAFDVAVEAHRTDRRKSGEPYIYHPIEVARIVAEEIGLDSTSVVAALLHDTVEDTYITLDDIENLFGKKERYLINGLTKISGALDQSSSVQAENFRKMILTLSNDVRVILIKLADRLHNMRTLDAMPKNKQLKIASETEFMYAPLAHRLGLYTMKTELEDLSLKYREPVAYEDIKNKLKKTQSGRTRFINQFSVPIIGELKKQGLDFELKGRTKSIYSIWKKIQKQNIPFEEVYDLFAIRIIVNTNLENEKNACWNVYSIVTDTYLPNIDRLRDWISNPKANGYESLHCTVMSEKGRWVEVQIRTKRMDEIAEKGYAAHWKYKGANAEKESGLDRWLRQVRELLENANEDAIDFIDDFKLNLFADEIYVFTPNGELKKLPMGATALDFAFEIHSQVGSKCIGAKVNKKLVPLSHKLNSGDQVEIINGKNQKPSEDWLNFVTTGKAKSRIRTALKEEKKAIAADGKEILKRKMRAIKADFLSINIDTLLKHYKEDSVIELYFHIATGRIDLKKLKGFVVEKGRILFPKAHVVARKEKKSEKRKETSSNYTKSDTLVLNDDNLNLEYRLSKCCAPIPGDDIFGFVTIGEGIKVHRINCPNSVHMLSKFDYRVIKAKWASQKEREFMAEVEFKGIDDVGLVHAITDLISKQLHVNMKAISFESEDGIFIGHIKLFVHNTTHLNGLIDEMTTIKGVRSVKRVKHLGE